MMTTTMILPDYVLYVSRVLWGVGRNQFTSSALALFQYKGNIYKEEPWDTFTKLTRFNNRRNLYEFYMNRDQNLINHD